MFHNLSDHSIAILQNLLVTFLWATSWVLIKYGLEEIPAVTFAGLRYFLAFLTLLAVFLRSGRREEVRAISCSKWIQLGILGIFLYTVAQGAQFVALANLPAVTVNLVLSFTSVVVALLGVILIGELPAVFQWAGILLSLVGALVYFYPFGASGAGSVGWIAAVTGVFANAIATVMGRSTNRRGDLSPLTVTVITMGVGGTLLLAVGVIFQGLPPISLTGWVIIAWLAVINTAFTFTLWNTSLRVLSAAESSVIINSMMIQIPILAVVFLGETLSARQVIGLGGALAGILLVQLTSKHKNFPQRK